MVARTGVLFAFAAALACTSAPPAIYTGSLSGSATYQGGGDSAGILISVSGPVSAAALTDASGTWSVASLPAGTYAISATAPDGLEAVLETSATVASGPVQASPLVFTGLGSAAGSVLSGAAGIPGVVVLAQGTGLAAVTDSSGNYQLNGLPTGSYDLVASLGGTAGAAQRAVVIAHGRTTQVPQMVLAAPPILGATLSGALVITGVAPQQGLPVSLQGPISSAAITAADGTFVFSGLPDGTYTLAAQVRSTLPNLRTLTAIIAHGQSVSGALLTLAPVGIVRGKATLANNPSGNASIAVTAAGSASSAVTDDLGRYQLANVPAGPATIQAAIIGGGSASTTVTAVWNQEVVAPDLNLSSAQAHPTGELSGHALFVGATDNSGINVTLRGIASASLVTGVDGAFDFSAIPDGDYQLTASASGTREGSASLSVTLGAGGLSGLLLQLTPVAQITGLVTEQDGTPVPAALVFLNGGVASAVTAIDGSYVLSGAPVGTSLAVQASTADELSQLLSLAPLTRGEVAHADQLVLVAHGQSAILAGTATLLSGAPAAGAQLSATGSALAAISATLDGAGGFSFNAPEGIYDLSISASDGSSETVPVASLAGSSGLVWGGPSPLPIGAVELQWAHRLGSAEHATLIARAQTSQNPLIRATNDALILTGYADITGATKPGSPAPVLAGEGTLWLETQGTMVRLPSAGVIVPSASCGLSTDLTGVTSPGPVLGPEHTALYTLPTAPKTPGPLEIGRPDGTVIEPFGPLVDNRTGYLACVASSCNTKIVCTCTPTIVTNTQARPIASGGDTVVYLGWQSTGSADLTSKPSADQLFAFDIHDALGATRPTPLQITTDNDTAGSAIYVTADGKWAWYSSATRLAVISTTPCTSNGLPTNAGTSGCNPLVVARPGSTLPYPGFGARVLSASKDNESLLICMNPIVPSGHNADGSAACGNIIIASADGTVVRDLGQAPVWQFTANDGTEFLIYDDQDNETGIVVEPFAATRTRSVVMASDADFCGWDWETDGDGVIVTAGPCTSAYTGQQPPSATRIAGIPLSFAAGAQPAAVVGEFSCVAPISGTKLAFSDAANGDLQLLSFAGGTVSKVTLDDGQPGRVGGCGAVQRAPTNSANIFQHRFLPSSERVAWFDDPPFGGETGGNYTLHVADVFNPASPTTTASITLPAIERCSLDQLPMGSYFAQGATPSSPLLVHMSADGSTAAVVECGLNGSLMVAGGVTLARADGSFSDTQPLPLATDFHQRHLLLADGTLVFLAEDSSGATSLGTASIASGQLAVASVPGSSGTLIDAYVAPDESALAIVMAESAPPHQGALGALVRIGPKAQSQLVASNVLVAESGGPALKLAAGCTTDASGFLPGVGIEASPDGQALLFRSGVVGSELELYGQQQSRGLLQALRLSDGKVQPLLGRALEGTYLPGGAVLGIRQESPAPYGFQDGLYLATPWGQP